MPSICFVAHNAVPAVFPGHGETIGGIETGAWTIAREMARQSHSPVFLYLRHHKPLPVSEKQGVRIVVRVEPWRGIRNDVADCIETGSGFPKLKRFRWGLLWRGPLLLLTRPFRARDLPPMTVESELARVPCDVYVAFGVSAEVSRVIATARSLGRQVILLLQSNLDVPHAGGKLPAGVSAATAEFVLREADVIIGQSPLQADRVLEFCGRRIEWRPPPIDLEAWRRSSTDQREYVLWVGRADCFHKRPRLCLELARRLPDVPFLMVMNKFDPEIEREIKAEQPPNVDIRSCVPFEQMPQVFGGALAFLSTSSDEYEGFPNVLLQAAATETPIVTMHDFADFVQGSGAGVVTGEQIDRVESALRSIADTDNVRRPRPDVMRHLAEAHDISAYCRWLEAAASAAMQKEHAREGAAP